MKPPTTDPLDPRLAQLVQGQLDEQALAVLEREAENDPALRRQLEAFRPMSTHQVDVITRMGLANRPRSAPPPQGASVKGRPWLWVLALTAAVGLGFLLLPARSIPQYALTEDQTSSVQSPNSPIALTLVPDRAPDAPVHVTLWARTSPKSAPAQVPIPIRSQPDGRIHVQAPAHRLTGGRFGQVELAWVISDQPRGEDAAFPAPNEPGIAVVQTHVSVTPPAYALALNRPSSGPRMRSAPTASTVHIDLRPEVRVEGGVTAHLFVIAGLEARRLPIEPESIGDSGVQRFNISNLPPLRQGDAPLRFVIAVGPTGVAPRFEQPIWTENGLASPPPRWWFGAVPKRESSTRTWR